ncbi:STAS domain-containing protein [Streptomyces sp. NPDC059582]|uniref:STAS domain-containing protein n=1 Tax=Streptomyces sp. NPDC059582 TaxID=3346875 RepID=UPI00368C1F18
MPDSMHGGGPPRLVIGRRVADGIRVVTVRGALDYDVKGAFSDALFSPDSAASPLRIVIDLSGVTFMDSAGLSVLIATHHTAAYEQGWLRIAGAPPPVQRLLELTGVDRLIPCHPTTEHALTTP